MGCEISHEKNNDIISVHTEEQFKLSYKELVSQDRGHVFDLYHFSNIINRSNYSIVRKVTSRASEQPRVCKIVPLVNKKYFTIISQVEYLKKLDHPNVIQIIQYFLQPSFLYIILEDIPGNRILSELNKVKNGILFEDFVEIITQLLRTVDFCHRKMIAHRAITIQNIMLFWNQDKPFLKLIDFSQACTIGCATPLPFLMDKRNIVLNQGQINQTDKMDIYDCGIVIATLLQGKKIKSLNTVVNYKEILQNTIKVIKQINLSKKIQKDLIQLLSLMLVETPNLRPSAEECLNHSFFKHFNKTISSKKALSSLLSFKAENNLKYLFSMYASLNMTSAIEKAEYLTQFYNLDKNKDGQIQIQELIQGIKNTFNLSQDQASKHAQEMFINLDKNKSGTLNFSQYVIGTVRLSKHVSKEFLQRMFNEIDTNKDGLISQIQISNMMIGMDKKVFLQGKKQVNFRQFRQIMIKLVQEEEKGKI